MPFDENGKFRVYPEDETELPVEKPAKVPHVILWLTVAGLVCIAVWIVVSTTATWTDLWLTIIVGILIFLVFFATAIFWISWHNNRRDDN